MGSLEEMVSETVSAITQAFQDVSRAGGVSLHETRVLDDCGSDVERAEAKAKDTDNKWQDVPNSTLEKPDLSLCFLDDISFRYYIPAYMVWQLRYFSTVEKMGCITDGAALNALSCLPPCRLLTHEQSRSIYKFLYFYTQHGDEYDKQTAQTAIKAYWFKFR
jgi:hypothetical protein